MKKGVILFVVLVFSHFVYAQPLFDITTTEGFSQTNDCVEEESCSVDVVFHPTREGSYEGQLVISSDDDKKTVGLHGIGVSTTQEEPSVSAPVEPEQKKTEDIPTSPIFHLSFDQDSPIDHSSSGHEMTINGLVEHSSQGVFDHAYQFEGKGSVVVMEPNQLFFDSDDDFSLSLWVKTKGYVNKGSNLNVLINRGLVPSTGYGISLDDANTIEWYAGDPDTTAILFENVHDNEWHHLVGVKKGTKLILYHNGVESDIKGKASDGKHFLATAELYIGGTAGRYFTGSIDEVSVWDYALSSQEVSQLYSATKTLIPPITGAVVVDTSLHQLDFGEVEMGSTSSPRKITLTPQPESKPPQLQQLLSFDSPTNQIIVVIAGLSLLVFLFGLIRTSGSERIDPQDRFEGFDQLLNYVNQYPHVDKSLLREKLHQRGWNIEYVDKVLKYKK